MVERSCRFYNMFGLLLEVDLSGDGFDESEYDAIHGEGAAQRAVDSIRAEKQDGGDTNKDADGGKKEPTIEEEEKMVKDALEKIMNILAELPPDAALAASVALKATLPGPSMGSMMGMLTMMGGPFVPPFPFGGRFG